MPNFKKILSKIILSIFLASNILPSAALAIENIASSSVDNIASSTVSKPNKLSLIEDIATSSIILAQPTIQEPAIKESTATTTNESLTTSTKESLTTSTNESLTTSTKELLATTTKESTATTTNESLATSTKESTATTTEESLTTSTNESFATSTKESTATTTKELLPTTTENTIKENIAPNIDLNYSSLMRQALKLKDDTNNQEQKLLLAEQIEQFMAKEKERLTKLNIPSEKQDQYLKRLQSQIDLLKGKESGTIQTMSSNFIALFSRKEEDSREVKMPENPGGFEFTDKEVEIEKAEIIDPNNFKPSLKASFKDIVESIVLFFKPQKTLALAVGQLPIAADLAEDEDGGEIIINLQIKTLAASLNHNPVDIFNYVRNNISYEPYYGAKKGNLGCLKERVCNDVDSASLTISLLRASGIPARYKKSFAKVDIELLKSLLAVDEAETVSAAFTSNEIPIYTSSNNTFIIERIFVDYFYEYDERGANISNTLNLETIQSIATSTNDIQAYYAIYPKAMWMSMDTIIKPYKHIKKEIISETANFNNEKFWNDHFSYQGKLSPIEKYQADLKAQTGKDINDVNYQSKREIITKEYHIVPPALPFKEVIIKDDNGNPIKAEVWASLPENRKNKLTISLKKENNNEIVLTHTFNASLVNNTHINLYYEGATQADKDIIESYGGIHQTPSELVNLTAYLLINNQKYPASQNLKIGDSLLLGFDYLIKDESFDFNDKFSTAGNSAGIYLIFSQVQADSFFDDPNIDESVRNSRILLKGNAEIARQYIRQLAKEDQTLSQAFDMGFNTHITRAVITQNRVLAKSDDGTPTSFDFKGLNIDATSLLAVYSRRGHYSNNRRDFMLLNGLNASYQENNVFEKIAGLDSISTVKGLQYANALGDYTIHTINQSNKSVIDSLDFSQNTKDNFYADVQAGKTIITPNKLVMNNNWFGLFYVSLMPNGGAMYAIGEQTQSNGGYSTIEFETVVRYSRDNKPETYFTAPVALANSNIEQVYSYSDKSIYGMSCRADKDWINSVINTKNNTQTPEKTRWKEEYGQPCAKLNFNFGENDHDVILAKNASLFKSDSSNYNYWEMEDDAEGKIDTYIDKIPNVNNEYNLRFSNKLGIYLKSICTNTNTSHSWNCNNDNYETLYYTPYENGSSLGRVYRLKDKFLTKASQNNNSLMKTLGFPTSDEIVATSPKGQTGIYQNFLNGSLYYYYDWIPRVYYTYGKLTKIHNDNGGITGNFGFPKNNPKHGKDKDNNNFAYQLFENEQEIGWNKTKNTISVAAYKPYRCELYGSVTEKDKLLLYATHGVAKSGFGVIEDLGSVIAHPLKTIESLSSSGKELYEAVKMLDAELLWEQTKDFLSGASIAAYNAWQATKNECSSRYFYMSGVFIGEVIRDVLPQNKVSKLTSAQKLKIANQAKIAKIGQDVFLENVSKIESGMLDTLMNSYGIWDRFKRDKYFSKFISNVDELDRYEHIFKGHIINGSAKGWHHHPSRKNDNTYIVGNKNPINPSPDEVYEAKVKIDGVDKYSKSTFFPDSWGEDKVLDVINKAYDRRRSIPSNKITNQNNGRTLYEEIVINDIKIDLVVDTNTEKIVAVFPSQSNLIN